MLKKRKICVIIEKRHNLIFPCRRVCLVSVKMQASSFTYSRRVKVVSQQLRPCVFRRGWLLPSAPFYLKKKPPRSDKSFRSGFTIPNYSSFCFFIILRRECSSISFSSSDSEMVAIWFLNLGMTMFLRALARFLGSCLWRWQDGIRCFLSQEARLSVF